MEMLLHTFVNFQSASEEFGFMVGAVGIKLHDSQIEDLYVHEDFIHQEH
jgi:hypothetical protein